MRNPRIFFAAVIAGLYPSSVRKSIELGAAKFGVRILLRKLRTCKRDNTAFAVPIVFYIR